ncbi:MAG: beta-lactamase family protein [Bacteroidetes bacterium]|nr:beta-lactamase family protein [Bacteroidota bacterium]MBU1373298.1 beta-lactamase family protein [Bacteroidota bacterium]MBU1486350.1 beta-lactamase family protein [Bacteroidota bacterium]MBU1759387.1 beta-lactamase family protein [Bacteroidota bacterium]MBU2046500.1 beta-lactamase family protein [Bacteroidota bacterium]
MRLFRKGNQFFAIALVFSLGFSACSPKVNKGLVAATNIKKLGIEEANLDRIDSLLGSALINKWAAGATALVAVNGKVIYDKGFGFRDRESKALMSPTTEFRIASMTKPIVTAAAMKLIEEGKLKLDDPVSKYIPEFKNMKVIATFNVKDTTYTTVDAQSTITIKNLMTHTSGIGYGFINPMLGMIYAKNGIPDLAVADEVTIGDKMKKLGTLPLAVQPNSTFFYGLSIDVLGAVVEKASGKNLAEYVNETILKPLGMDNTFFYIPAEKANRLAVMYAETKEGRLERVPTVSQGYNVNFPITGARTYFSGGSGLSSTVEDYAKFCQMILNRGEFGGKIILQPETVDLMTTNQIGDLNVGKDKFGLGFEITTEKGTKNGSKVGKLSWGGAFNTTFWIDPERKSVAVLMTQVYPAIHKNQLFSQFEQLVNDALDR